MANKSEFSKELKGLGLELAAALKQIRSSREFKDLQKEVTSGLKNMSDSLVRSLKAAQKSQHTTQIQKRVKRVIKSGRKEGGAQAQKAQAAAAKGIRKARTAIKEMTKKLDAENHH